MLCSWGDGGIGDRGREQCHWELAADMKIPTCCQLSQCTNLAGGTGNLQADGTHCELTTGHRIKSTECDNPIAYAVVSQLVTAHEYRQ